MLKQSLCDLLKEFGIVFTLSIQIISSNFAQPSKIISKSIEQHGTF